MCDENQDLPLAGGQLRETTGCECTFSYGKQAHHLTVLIDHCLGGGVKDCWAGNDPEALREDLDFKARRSPDMRLEPISPRRALAVLREATSKPPCPVEIDPKRTRRATDPTGAGRRQPALHLRLRRRLGTCHRRREARARRRGCHPPALYRWPPHGSARRLRGLWGYETLLEAIADPAHEEHEHYVEWVGDVWGLTPDDVVAFDPAAFDLDRINMRLVSQAARHASAPDGEQLELGMSG